MCDICGMEYTLCKKCSAVDRSENCVLYQVVIYGPIHIKDGDKDRYLCGIRWLETDQEILIEPAELK